MSIYKKNILISSSQQRDPCKTASEYVNGGFAKYTNFFVPLNQTLNIKSCKLKYFRCRNLFYDFCYGFNVYGVAISNGSTFLITSGANNVYIMLRGTFTITELVTEIQNQINNSSIGSGVITVTPDTINRNLIFSSVSTDFALDFVTPFPGPYEGADPYPPDIIVPRTSASLGFFNEVYNADVTNNYTIRSPRCYNFQAGSNLYLNINPIPLGINYCGSDQSDGNTFIIPFANVAYGDVIYYTENSDFTQYISEFSKPCGGFQISLNLSDDSIAANGGHNITILIEIEYTDNLY